MGKFSESQQEYLLRGAKTDEEIQKKKDEMGLSPMTAQIVCIGLMLCSLNDDGSFNEEKTESFAVDNSLKEKEINELMLSTQEKCYLSSEAYLLEIFWKILKKYDPVHLISFNGRNFDAPFLMLRSSLLRIKPSKNLMAGTKFSYSLHTDLIDELTFTLVHLMVPHAASISISLPELMAFIPQSPKVLMVLKYRSFSITEKYWKLQSIA